MGPLQEEFGWRGYALEQLQQRWNALVSSCIVGHAVGDYGIYHFSSFLTKDFITTKPFWGLLLSTTLISILFTWLYNNTNKSILVALIFHAMFNFSHYIFPVLSYDQGGLLYFALLFIVIAVVLSLFGYKTMTKHQIKGQSIMINKNSCNHDGQLFSLDKRFDPHKNIQN